MSLEMRIDDVVVVVVEVTAGFDFCVVLQTFGRDFGFAVGIKYVDGGEGESVFFCQCYVRIGVAAFSYIQHIGFHESGIYFLY